jgi:hypothetical protein
VQARRTHLAYAPGIVLLGIWATYWTCVRSGVMLHAALPWSLHLGVTLPIFLISSSSSFTLHPYTLLVTSRSSSWPHPSTWTLVCSCYMAVAFLVRPAVFVVHGVIRSARVALTCFTPLSQAVRDHLGLFGPGLRFVVENECTGAYARHHLMSFSEWEVCVGRDKNE